MKTVSDTRQRGQVIGGKIQVATAAIKFDNFKPEVLQILPLGQW